MRVLFLSFYFEPDLSAGAFRAAALVKALQSHLPNGSNIDIFTTLPNRYRSFSSPAPERETIGIINIHRIRIPAHRSGFVDQSRAFFSYALEVFNATRGKNYDLIIATSSRLMTAFLARQISRRVGAPLYLDIRDLFVDTLRDIKPNWIFRPVSFSLKHIEKITIRHARKVNLVSRGFECYFVKNYPGKPLSFFPNGIDEEFIKMTNSAPSDLGIDERPISVLYAGNIGEGQGLHTIIPDLAEKMAGSISIVVIGDGGGRMQLQASIDARNIENVSIANPVARRELVNAYLNSDVLFLHLNEYEAFKSVLPSKIFEYAATGKPIWAGVSGFASQFITENIDNAQVFPPCDVVAAEAAFSKLRLQYTPRSAFVEKYDRGKIMDGLARDIIEIYRLSGSDDVTAPRRH